MLVFFKDNFSYETSAGQQHLRCRKKILAQNYYSMISHNSECTRHSSIHPDLHFSNNIVGRFNIEVPFLTASNKGVNYAHALDTLFPRHVTQAGGCEIGRSSDDLISIQN